MLLKACGKRPLLLEVFKKIANEVEAQLLNKFIKEVDSSEIAKITIKKLKYVRQRRVIVFYCFVAVKFN